MCFFIREKLLKQHISKPLLFTLRLKSTSSQPYLLTTAATNDHKHSTGSKQHGGHEPTDWGHTERSVSGPRSGGQSHGGDSDWRGYGEACEPGCCSTYGCRTWHTGRSWVCSPCAAALLSETRWWGLSFHQMIRWERAKKGVQTVLLKHVSNLAMNRTLKLLTTHSLTQCK